MGGKRKKKREREKSNPISKFGKAGESNFKNAAFGKETRAEFSSWPGADPQTEAAEIARMIRRHEYKAAVAGARAIHKRLGTQESEALLVDAYLARIQDMLDHGMPIEGMALLGLVEERYVSARGRTEEMRLRIGLQQGLLADVLCPLKDPECPSDTRNAVENAIRSELTDLRALARCEVLPPEHSLRTGAAAAASALEAVTSGPAAPEAVLLPEISRRSPLAPWKMLVRAIASYYQNDDDGCLKYLDCVDAGSVPSRLVPALRALATGAMDERLGAGELSLVAMISGRTKSLRDSLQRLDEAFAGRTLGRTLQAIQRAVTECGRLRPDFLEKLKQHISVRSAIRRIPSEEVLHAMEGPSLKNAYFWRLSAKAAEEVGDEALACSLWEEFRRNAVCENWFADEGSEVEALYLHMAELLEPVCREHIREMQEQFRRHFTGYENVYKNQPLSVQAAAPSNKPKVADLYFLEPRILYRRACRLNPAPDTFERWLNRVKEDRDWKAVEEVASIWHEALPKDSRPLLHLVELTEKRDALRKALGYLEKAECLDGLNPDVRRARFRLLVATARRHLKQKKLHLLEKDFEAIAALPQAQEGDRPAILAALRCVAEAIGGDRALEARQRREVSDRLGGDPAAAVLLAGLCEGCGLIDLKHHFLAAGFDGMEVRELAAAVARGCALGAEAGTDIAIPQGLKSRLMKDLAGHDCPLRTDQVRALAESALRQGYSDLAYRAAGLGLARGGREAARFLLLRARSLPPGLGLRRKRCLVAAADLARRQRELDLVAEAVETRLKAPGYTRGYFPVEDVFQPEDKPMSAEQIDEVIRYEREQVEYPASTTDDVDICRRDIGPQVASRSAGRLPDPFAPDDEDDESFFEEEEAGEEWDEMDEVFGSLESAPPRLREMLSKILSCVRPDGSLPDLDEILEKDPSLVELLEKVLGEDLSRYRRTPDPGEYLPGLDPSFWRSRRKKRSRRS